MGEHKDEWKRVVSYGESCEVLQGQLRHGELVRIGTKSLSSARKGKDRPW